MNGYKTLLQEANDEYIVNKSRFIGSAAPVETPEQALAFLDKIRQQYKDATHNCYAYIIGKNAGIMRYSDDGEPGGTAGMPIIEVMKARGVVDCAVVVTRYFGGILLGAGGLVRAYSHSTALAIEQAQVQIMLPCHPVLLQADYSLYGKIAYALPKTDLIQKNVTFEDQVRMELLVRDTILPELQKQLIDLTGNQIQLQIGDKEYADFSSCHRDS